MHRYNKIDQQIHLLSQVIANANRTFVPRKEDDSHTNLYFDPVSHRLYGRWIISDNGPIILALNLKDLQFEWLDNSLQRLLSFPIATKNISQIETEIETHLPDLGLSKFGFSDKLHFEIPNYDFADQPFDVFELQAIDTWQGCRQLANDMCVSLLGFLQTSGEIRIWPHHFDTGIYVEPNEKLGIGFGLAMEDEMVGAPYFYLSGYALQGASFDYENPGSLESGKWVISEHWQGAVLSMEDILEKEAINRHPLIFSYLEAAASWFLQHH